MESVASPRGVKEGPWPLSLGLPTYWSFTHRDKTDLITALSDEHAMPSYCAYKLLHELSLLASVVFVASCHSSPDNVFFQSLACCIKSWARVNKLVHCWDF